MFGERTNHPRVPERPRTVPGGVLLPHQIWHALCFYISVESFRLLSDQHNVRMYLEYWCEGGAADTMVTLPRVHGESVAAQLKRLIDVVGTVCLLLGLSPVFLMTAAVIKLTSPGPVFFWQERLGLHQRPFRMLKFRTMIPTAHLQEGALQHAREGVFFKVQNDPRITPVGKVLRKYSIDELPQLINVLKGDMSLVGPRPLFHFELQRFERWKPLRRFSMKPGLTGIWQVSGRSKTSDGDRMRYDVEYVERWSLLLDLQLLLKTIPAVLNGDGAV